MSVRLNGKIILYLSILAAYLVFWVHNDLEAHPGQFWLSLLQNTWKAVFILGINIGYFDYVLPLVTSQKHYRAPWIIASLIIHLGVFMLGLYAWLLLGNAIGIYKPVSTLSEIARFTPGAFLLFAVFKLFFDYFEAQQVRFEKKQAELVFLKSQINPHFLFNTLNNIYSLSQYEPKLVSESVLRLSKILRYMLYETDNDMIEIDNEVRVLHDYIDLEKLRYSKSVSIEFQHAIENHSEAMPPLLLLPLVENAFKHGVSQSRGKRFVHVQLTVQQQELSFIVKNSSEVTPAGREIKENIGLSNLKRRLKLLYKEFHLSTEQKDSIFTAVLKINLAGHV